jgi:hypothetical protein
MRVPHEARIESARRRHRQEDDERKGRRATRGTRRCDIAELDQRYEGGDREDIDIGPAAKLVDPALKVSLDAQMPPRAALDGDDKPGHAGDLRDGDDDARAENEDAERPEADKE